MIKALQRTDDGGELALKYRYEAIIDYMLANPHMRQGQIALEVGCTQAWLSQVVTSDGFQARYNVRRQQLNEEQERSVSARLFDIADKAAERVVQELDKGDDCDAGFALDAQTRALRAMGFGAPKGGNGQEASKAVASDGVGAETLKLARDAIASQSVTMTRVTESVEISSGDRVEDSRVIEAESCLGPNEKVQGEEKEGARV